MKIAIEAQRIFRTNKHGMDFVILEALRSIANIDHENEYYVLVKPGEDRCLESSGNLHIVEVNCPSYPLWEQYALPAALKKIKPDLLHCTSNTAPICKLGIPLVITLHDIIFLEPAPAGTRSAYQSFGRIYRRWVVPKILPHCSSIITVSESEKEQISDFLSNKASLKLRKWFRGLVGSTLIDVIYNGFSAHFKPEPNRSIVEKYLKDEHYFFMIGNTDPKKNTARTLSAYAKYVKKTDTDKIKPLLVADLSSSNADAFLKEYDVEFIRPHLRLPGYIANTDLAALYSCADLFLFTSLRESFGIPILEAMACGTPAIISNYSAMKEVAGDGAVLISPKDEDDIASKIELLETDISFRQSAINYGLERVKSFSWDKTALDMIELYKRILKLN